MSAIPTNQIRLTTDEKLNRLAATLAVLATEMDMRDDEYAAAYGKQRVPETGPRMSLEEQVERILYAERYTMTAPPSVQDLW